MRNCFVWCVTDTEIEVGQVTAEETHWLLVQKSYVVCLSKDVTSLSWCANICSNFVRSSHYRCAPGGFVPAFTQLEQSFQKCHSISCWVRAALLQSCKFTDVKRDTTLWAEILHQSCKFPPLHIYPFFSVTVWHSCAGTLSLFCFFFVMKALGCQTLRLCVLAKNVLSGGKYNFLFNVISLNRTGPHLALFFFKKKFETTHLAWNATEGEKKIQNKIHFVFVKQRYLKVC